jgi:hypothetical protein
MIPTRAANPRSGLLAALRRGWKDDRAAQIAEFAVSLPLLVVFTVGIFDFSGAFSLKQKLMNAAREAARVAASDPATDLNNTLPVSVSDAYQVVDNYLLSEKINTCGLTVVPPSLPPAGLTWTYSSSGSGCPGTGITLTINRGCKSTITSGSNINLIETCITISYAYKWQFNSVMGLLGGTAAGPTSLSATAQAFNEN